jgi:methyl-accepting chemotaxis protein
MLRLGFEATNLALLGALLFMLFLQAGLHLGPDQLAELLAGALWLLPLLIFIDLLFGVTVFVPIYRLLKPLDTGEAMGAEHAGRLWRLLILFPARAVLISVFMWATGAFVAASWMIRYGDLGFTRESVIVFLCCALLGMTTSLGYFFRARFIIRPVLEDVSRSLPPDFDHPRFTSIRRKLLIAFIFTLVTITLSMSVLAWTWKERGRVETALEAGHKRMEDMARTIKSGRGEIKNLGLEDHIAFRLRPFIVDQEGVPAPGGALSEQELEFIRDHHRLLGVAEWKRRSPLRASLTRFFSRIVPLPREARLKELQTAGPRTQESSGTDETGPAPERWIVLMREPLRGGLFPGVVVELKSTPVETGSASSLSFYLLLFYVVIFIGVIIFYADWLATDVSEPIKSLQRIMERVSRDQAPEPAVVESDDEVGELTSAYNLMSTVLGDKMEEVSEVIEAVRSGAGDLNRIVALIVEVASDQASGAVEQASSLHQISSTSEEIAATLRTIAESAQNVDEVAGQSLTASHEGQRQLLEVIGGMEGARLETQNVAEKMVSFQEQATKIEGVLDLIRDISGKTDLIALNAAIEASAVGEAGDRFSIVASEMRKLAEQTVAGTEQIQRLVDELQTTTSTVIMATEEGEKKVTRALELTDSASETFQSIVHWAGETARSAQEIALSSNQQTTATDHLASALGEIQGVAKKFADTARSLEKSVAEIEGLGTEFGRVLGRKGRETGNGEQVTGDE